MTVKHLQTIQRQQLSTAVATDPAVLTKFRSGFSECATEVSRYVNHLENVDPSVKQRLVSHLNNCVNNLQQVNPAGYYNHYVPYMPERLYPEVKVGFQSDVQSGDENNNGSARIQIPSNVQLIPSRLPNGELALLVPPSAGITANFPFFPPSGNETGSRLGQPSAFTAVQRTHSPLLSPSTSTSSFEENHHSDQHYPASVSPPPQSHLLRFKVPEQSPASSSSIKSFSSPETQKPHISSSSDRSSHSPVTSVSEHSKLEHSAVNSCSVIKRDADSFEAYSAAAAASMRQPLSVITDKYNRTLSVPPRRESGLKRHHSDGLLGVAEKKPRYEPTTTTTTSSVASTSHSPTLRIKEEHHDDLHEKTTSISSESAATANGDMWRPW